MWSQSLLYLSGSITFTRFCLMMVLNGLTFLARQGCALRGDKDEGNLIQLMKLMGINVIKVYYISSNRNNLNNK